MLASVNLGTIPCPSKGRWERAAETEQEALFLFTTACVLGGEDTTCEHSGAAVRVRSTDVAQPPRGGITDSWQPQQQGSEVSAPQGSYPRQGERGHSQVPSSLLCKVFYHTHHCSTPRPSMPIWALQGQIRAIPQFAPPDSSKI